MRRLTVLLFLLMAAPAHAAVLGELPFEPLPGAGTCLRGTATPGTIALLGPLGRRTSATDLREVGGAAPAARVRLGALVDCAAVAVDPGGAAVMAGAVSPGRGKAEVRVAVRDPGGAFGAPLRLGSAPILNSSVSAAVAPSGAAVVAWAQGRGGDFFSDAFRTRIMVARRAPGGAFGPARALTGWRRGDGDYESFVTAGIDTAGHATVAWTQPVRGGAGLARAIVAHAEPGAAFSAAAHRPAREPGARHAGGRARRLDPARVRGPRRGHRL